MRLLSWFPLAVLLSLSGCKGHLPAEGSPDASHDVSVEDPDEDGIKGASDNCPNFANPEQEDADKDGVGDACDNCRAVANSDQLDADRDTIGNACDNCPFVANIDQPDKDKNGKGDDCDLPDGDGDGVPDTIDNCPTKANSTQPDADHDGSGDACDNCVDVANRDQTDANHDGIGDACATQLADLDGDGLPGSRDNCPAKANPGQEDADKDGVGDACDNCPYTANFDQVDANRDGVGDVCKSSPTTPPGYDLNKDSDGDTVPDRRDNCPNAANKDQADADRDAIGDACDNCRTVANWDQADSNSNCAAAPYAADPHCGDPCDINPPTVTCGEQTANWSRQKPDILVVIDRSLSMDEENPTKWSQAVAALNSLADAMWDDLRLGLATFAGDGGLCAPPDLKLTLGDHTATQIKQSYADVHPGSATPAALALETAYNNHWLTDASDPLDAQRRKAVLFITDGQPNCDPAAHDQTDTTAAAATATATAAGRFFADGVPVFVVGFGSGIDATKLNNIAQAGGTDNPNDAVNRYYQANNTTELERALTSIASALVTCDLVLSSTPPAPDRMYVTSNGTKLVRDDPNGWIYTAASKTITIQGTACAALKSSTSPVIAVKFGCAPPPCSEMPEVCDYIDNNCNGTVDEGCGPGEICGDKIDNDQDNQIDEGCPPPCVPKPEVCDNLIDEDCDGRIDNCPSTCPSGKSPEICDGIDNDCDGEIDEGCPKACAPAAEVCDHVDNDCDGKIDEGCVPAVD